MILHDDSLIREYTDHGLLVRPDAAGPVRRGALGPPGPRRDAGFPDRAELLATEPRTLTRVRPEGGGAGDVAAGARLRKDEVVVVRLPNTWELVALYLAVWRAGGIISSLPMQWREHELSYVSRLTDARTYIAPPSFKGFDHHGMARALGGRHAAAGADLAERAVVDGGRLQATAPIVNMTGVGACLVGWLQSAGILVLHHPVNMPLLLRQLTGHDVQFTLLVPTLLNMISKLPTENRTA